MPDASSPAPLMLTVSGLRGTFGGSLTPEVVARYCGAFATWVRHHTPLKKGAKPVIVVGWDGRRGSESVASLAMSALELHGCRVHNMFGPVMTPTVGLAVDHLGAAAGLQVTASHNPQQWCGLKPIVRAGKAKAGAVAASAPDQATADALIALYRAGAPAAAPWDGIGGETVGSDAADAHPQRVVQLLTQLKALRAVKSAKFRIALDAVTPSGNEFATDLLGRLGAKVLEVNDPLALRAGLFPHTPEPTRENLTGLCAFVKKAKGKISAGFALDPDGDRLAVVDERGVYIGEEYTLVLAALAMGELGQLKKGSVLAVNLSTSRMIEDVAARYGCRVVRSAVGEANVVQAMRANQSPFGGEGNGGVIWPKVTYIRDSLGAMALILALMAQRQQTISQLVAQVPAYCIIKRKVDLAATAIRPQAIIESLAKLHAESHPDTTDGVWVDFPDQRAWLHVRASNTEPILRLIAEAPTQPQAEAILDAAANALA